MNVTLAEGKFTYWGQNAGASTESFQNLVVERGKNTLTMFTDVNSAAELGDAEHDRRLRP